MKLPISVLILAKNEEKTIRFCIEPLRRRVREIIVCDTGSRDKTREIVRSMGIKLVKKKLRDDFSAVRNSLIDQAGQPWILMLDADRRIAPKDIPKFSALLNKKNADVYDFPLRNYTDLLPVLYAWHQCNNEYPLEEKFSGAYGYYPSRHLILFKNTPRLRFSFPVHETLLPDIEKNRFKIKTADIPIHHFEFKKGFAHHLKKHAWYLKLERKTARRWPQYPKNYFNLASDLILSGKNLPAAVQAASFLTRRWPDSPLFWALKAVTHMLQENLPAAEIFALKSLRLKKNSVNLCLYGWIQLKRKRFKRAEHFLRQALKKRKDHPLALNLLGVVKERTGKDREALAWFARALKILPVYPEALFNRNLCQERQRRPAPA